MLRRIFGPTKDRNNMWRIKTNNELNSLNRNKNRVNCIKAERIRWFGRVDRMTNDRVDKKILCVEIDIYNISR